MSNAPATPPANPYGPEGPTYDQQVRDLAYHILREQGQDPLLASQDDWHDACGEARMRLANLLAQLDHPETWAEFERPEFVIPTCDHGRELTPNGDVDCVECDAQSTTMEQDTRPIEPGPGWTTGEVWILTYDERHPVHPEDYVFSTILFPTRGEAVESAGRAIDTLLAQFDPDDRPEVDEMHVQDNIDRRSDWLSTWYAHWDSGYEGAQNSSLTITVAMARFGMTYIAQD